jgi:hypothetical protein
MKGLSVAVTILLFAGAIALSSFLKKTGFVPQETGGFSVAANTNNSAAQQGPGEMASFVRNTRLFRN